MRTHIALRLGFKDQEAHLAHVRSESYCTRYEIQNRALKWTIREGLKQMGALQNNWTDLFCQGGPHHLVGKFCA